ncbi:MAG: LysM peptidoglycan-binding domain-containing protein [Aquihabitans sp.]
MTTRPSVTPAAASLALVGSIIATLHLLGGSLLAAPPVGSFDALRTWAETRDPVTVGFVCVRLLALAVAYHLVVTTAVAVLGHALHKPALVAAAERTTFPPLRGGVRRIAGLTLTAAAAFSTPLPGAGAAVAPTAPPVLVRVTPPAPAGGVASMERQPTMPTTPPTMAVESEAEPVDHGVPPVDPTSHTVQSGDHLWSIAEDTVQAHLDHAATDPEISDYWQQLLAANPQLDNPDLLFPGDTVTLPPR